MKNAYLIRVSVSDREKVAGVLDAVSSYGMVEVEVLTPAKMPTIDLSEPKVKQKPKVSKFPRLRKSKVNDAILGAMNGGPATIKALKSALEGAGMSASSLSTGLSILTKSGQIERVGDGEYALKAA